MKKLEINVDFLMLFVAGIMMLFGEYIEGILLLSMFFIAEKMQSSVNSTILRKLRNCKLSIQGFVVCIEGKRNTYKEYKDINVGDKLLIKTGDIFPCESILDSDAYVSEVSINGEPEMVLKKQGDRILSGSINAGNSVTSIASSRYFSSVLQQIIENVDNKKDSIDIMDNVAFSKILKIYTYLIIFVFFVFILWIMMTGGDPLSFDIFKTSLYKSSSLLTVLSPCAVVTPLPIAMICFATSLYSNDIVVRNFKSVFKANKCKNIFFDKTGTLTLADHRNIVQEVYNSSNIDIIDISKIVFSMEKCSKHPIGRCLYSWSKTILQSDYIEDINIAETVQKYNRGLYTTYDGKKITIGACTKNIDHLGIHDHIVEMQIENDFIYFGIKTNIRKGAKEIIEFFNKNNCTVKILTGDSESAAFSVANHLGISEKNTLCSLSPNDKLKIIETSGDSIMIGDGINDAMALSKATLSIIVANDSIENIVISAADIVLLGDDIENIKKLFKKENKLRNIIIQNICLAILVILVGSFLVISNKINLSYSVILHEGSTILLALNSLRILF